MQRIRTSLMALAALAVSACSDLSDDLAVHNLPGEAIQLAGYIEHQNVTRANEQGFVSGDRMGVYIVDYEADTPGTLSTGNRASNLVYTFDGDNYRWTAPVTVYWRDRETPVDIYAYYPAVNTIAQPQAYSFEVQADQSTEAANGDLGGYEQSDLLWGKQPGVKPTEDVITVKLQHRLAGIRACINKGEGISDIEWQKLDKIVLVENTVRQASVDLATGTATAASGSAAEAVRMALPASGEARAVVVPQTVAAGKTLLSITIDGQTYTHSLAQPMQYQAGKLHNFTITVNKSAITGDYTVSVADDGISPWLNDETSHQFTMQQYVVVHCDSINTLRDCMTRAGIDYRTVQNLKVTGVMSNHDFELIRDEMPELRHLNLKTVTVKYENRFEVNGQWQTTYEDGILPGSAFARNNNIRSIVLPSSLKVISREAFYCVSGLMYSTLEIPEGVTTIEYSAFFLTGTSSTELVLPSTLERIDQWAFYHTEFKCNLNLSDNIRSIGYGAFNYARNFYGTFHVPAKLESFQPEMFADVGGYGNVSGSIEIPNGITQLPDHNRGWIPVLSNRYELILPPSMKYVGWNSLNGDLLKLELNEGLEYIGSDCFNGNNPFPIKIPSTVREIGANSFCGGYEGELVIPEGCLEIGGGSFSNDAFTSVKLPSRLESIGGGLLSNCQQLRSITIPKYVNFIGNRAFADDLVLQTIICLNPTPPTIEPEAFAGLYYDKVILEVPEQSVELYRRDDGWKKFQNITAYHELAFNIPEIVCLDRGTTRQGMIRAEGEWEVAECPDWISVSPSSGEFKDELTVTVSPATSQTREGRIVFRLKGSDYTTYTDVRQVVSDEYKEDATVVLQQATAGATPVPIFLVGEGYGADDIVSGKYLADMKEQMEHLFSVEPYKSYRQYFTVSTAYACSPQSGMSGLLRFQPENRWESADDLVWRYASEHGAAVVNQEHTNILVLCNTPYYSSRTSLWPSGLSLSWLGKNPDSYPYDQRGDVLHYLGGRGIGKLGPEYVNHFTFMKACICPGCNMTAEYNEMRARGWWQNVSITNKMNELPWQHLIFDERYAQLVDVYEGALNHARGTYRSENMSVMGAVHVYYYNTISRQEIVSRILQAAGEPFSLDQFFQNDVLENVPQYEE